MDPSGRSARPFGSVGVTLDRPATHIVIRQAERLEIRGEEQARVERYVGKLADYFGQSKNVDVLVKEAIPAHAGLGSGTQLAVATGTAYASLFGVETDPREIAMVLERGKRSGIGIGSFQTGGVLFDAGPNVNGGIAPILTRLPFPSKWRILLVVDRDSSAIHGDREIQAFGELEKFTEAQVADLCRRTVLGLLPAIAEEDFRSFSENVAYLQNVMGQYFAPVQGGHYTSARVGEAINWILAKGIRGVGQSSWGPTGIAFVESQEVGEAIISEARVKWGDEHGMEFILASGLNHGARAQELEAFPGDVDGEVGQPA